MHYTLDRRYFERIDENDDSHFYRKPRLNPHVDSFALEALSTFLARHVPSNSNILDLMAGYTSHLQESINYQNVVGLGLNKEDLQNNRQLNQRIIQDINSNSKLPFLTSAFEAVLISFSVQYIIHPLEIFREVGRVLRPGGRCFVPYSQRMFPTKAVAIWKVCSDADRARLLAYYFENTGIFENIRFDEITPEHTKHDPVYMVSARRSQCAY